MKSYYAVFYMVSGNALISGPMNSEEEVVDYIKNQVAKDPDRVVSTTYLAREQDSLRAIFGNPRSRDVKQDRKFMKSILAHQPDGR